MVSCAGELFRRGARDETFGTEMRVISMSVKLEGIPRVVVPAKRSASRDPQPQMSALQKAGATAGPNNPHLWL
jgi:hypothetical protein